MLTAGLLLAAGAGRRIGRPKALLRLNGRMLAAHLADVLADGGCDPVIVVIGALAEEVEPNLRRDLAPSRMPRGPKIVINPAWESGMASSLVVGLRAAADLSTDTGLDAVVVMLVDQPGVTAEAVRRVARLAGPDALVAASYDGRRGHPVLFGRNHWPGICASASGDVGARQYLKDHEVKLVECADVASDDDIDTPEAAAAWGID